MASPPIPSFYSDPEPTWAAPTLPTLASNASIAAEFRGLPAAYRKEAQRGSVGFGIEAAYLRAALAVATDVPPGVVHLLTNKTVNSAHSREVLQAIAEDERYGAFRAVYRSSASALDGARLACIPSASTFLYSELGAPAVMTLSHPIMEEVLRSTPTQIRGYHLALATFSYRNGVAIIDDFYSPMLTELPNGTPSALSDWPAILIRGIEQYARRAARKERVGSITDDAEAPSKSQRATIQVWVERYRCNAEESGGHIAVQHPYIEERYMNRAPGLDAILKRLGYQRPSGAELRSAVSPSAPPVPVDLLRMKQMLIANDPSGAPRDSSRFGRIQILPANRAILQARRYQEIFQSQFSPWGPGSLPMSSFPVLRREYRNAGGPLVGVEAAAALAPVTSILPRIAPLFPSHISQYLERLHRTPMLREALERTPRSFVPVSAGLFGAGRQDWWSYPQAPSEGAKFLHLKDQNRHPSLRFAVGGTSARRVLPLTVGFKGCGFLDLDGLQVARVSDLPNGIARFPVVRVKRYDENEIHGTWGGMLAGCAEQEFINLLGVSWLMNSVCPHLDGAVAEPLDAAVFLALPVWEQSGRVRWLASGDYQRQVLDDEPWSKSAALASLRTVSRSDVRLSQLVNRLLEAANMEMGSEEQKAVVDGSLSYLYHVHGYRYDPPPMGLPIDGKTGEAALVRYLRLAALRQPTIARSIYQHIFDRSFLTMAYIHGFGGHLGGFRIEQASHLAPRGGALTLRNVDCEGRLHDLDARCCTAVPGFSIYQQPNQVMQGQLLDLICLYETMGWMQLVLGQRSELPTGRVVHSPCGAEFKLSLLQSDAQWAKTALPGVESLVKACASGNVEASGLVDRTKALFLSRADTRRYRSIIQQVKEQRRIQTDTDSNRSLGRGSSRLRGGRSEAFPG